MMKGLKKKKGFTLIELIIVIAIIGILAAIAVPKFGDIQKNSKIKADIASAKTISDAVSVLVTQGKISEDVAIVEINDTAVAVATPSGASAIAAKEIGTYLQTVPKSSVYKDKFFKVAVDDGNAKIYVYDGTTKADGSAVADIEVYPDGDAPYDK